jgi:2-aminoadipate transaminase
MRPLLSSFGDRLDFPAIARLMNAALERPELLSLAAGFTDNASLPLADVGELVSEIVADRDLETLQYGPNQGRPALRQWVAARLDELDGSPPGTTSSAQVMLTNGSQQALHLAASVLCDAGDIILVESPTYFVFLEAIKGLGVRAVGLPALANGGPDLEATECLLRELSESGDLERVRAVYLVSYHSNPTSRSLASGEKRGLAEVLRGAGLIVPVLEDAAYRELGYEGPVPVPSVLAMPEFDGFPRLHLGTFTKTYATGLKVGFVVCDEPRILEKMLHLKGHQDFGTAHFNQAVLERAVLSGRFSRQLGLLRSLYREKRDILDATLRMEDLEGAGWTWALPDGGLYLWLRAPKGIRTGFDTPLQRRTLDAGVLYVPGCLCFAEDSEDRHVRLSFGVLADARLTEAGRRFARAAKEVTSHH